MKGTYGARRPILPRGTAAAALGAHGSDGSDPSPSWLVTFSREADTFSTAAHPARGFPRVRHSRWAPTTRRTNAEAEAAEDAAVPPPPASNRLGNCQVCDAGVPAKYRCPACSTATCSLACSKRHKSAGEGCTGKRDRTAFKDIRDFTDADVVSDYRFLEEALLEKDRAKRWRPEFAAGSDAAARADRAPAAAKTIALLTQQARARGVELFCMPDGMARRVANTTFYDRRRDRMQWRVEWLFHAGARDPDPSAAASATTTTRIVARAEMPNSTNIARRRPRARLVSAWPRRASARASPFRRRVEPDAPLSWRCFCRGRAAPGDRRFHRLRTEETIRANLAGKRLVEFPTLHVAVLPEDEGTFPEMEETKSDAAGVAGLEDGAEREAGENPDSG